MTINRPVRASSTDGSSCHSTRATWRRATAPCPDATPARPAASRHVRRSGLGMFAGSASARCKASSLRPSVASRLMRNASHSPQRGAAGSRGWSCSTRASARRVAPEAARPRAVSNAKAPPPTANKRSARTIRITLILAPRARTYGQLIGNGCRRKSATKKAAGRRLFPRQCRELFRRSASPAFLARQLLTDAGSLAGAQPEIIELGAPDIAAALHLYARDERRVGLEGALHPFARRDLAHGEAGIESAVALGDHHALVR